MWAASIVIRSESGSPISTPIHLGRRWSPPLNKESPTPRRMGVVIGAPLSDPITIPKHLPNIQGSRRDFYYEFNIPENTCETNRSLMCDFLSDMYDKGYTSVP